MWLTVMRACFPSSSRTTPSVTSVIVTVKFSSGSDPVLIRTVREISPELQRRIQQIKLKAGLIQVSWTYVCPSAIGRTPCTGEISLISLPGSAPVTFQVTYMYIAITTVVVKKNSLAQEPDGNTSLSSVINQ